MNFSVGGGGGVVGYGSFQTLFYKRVLSVMII